MVSSSVSLAGVSAATFGAAARASFAAGMAQQLNVPVSSITVTNVTDSASGRHLLASGATVAFQVSAPSQSATAAIASSITTATSTGAAALASSLSSAGLAVASVALVVSPVASSSIVSCKAGTYMSSSVQGSVSTCLPCAAGTYSGDSASTCMYGSFSSPLSSHTAQRASRRLSPHVSSRDRRC